MFSSCPVVTCLFCFEALGSVPLARLLADRSLPARTRTALTQWCFQLGNVLVISTQFAVC